MPERSRAHRPVLFWGIETVKTAPHSQPHSTREPLTEPDGPITGARIVWESLLREGVDILFGFPGGTIMPTYDELPPFPIHHVLVRHEQGAAHMADGYARASGKVGVAMATSGPGATNLVTGIANAMLDSVPIVCITGQVPSALIGSDAFQETDITGVTLPITKHNYLVTRPEEVAPAIREAFHLARTGRPGPVVVDITKDAQQGTCEFKWPDEPIRLPGYRAEHVAPESDLEAAAALIAAAERPVILAGHGIIKAKASEPLLELVRKADIPVASTLLGLGCMPGDHPRNLGMMGMHGEAWVNQAIQTADLLIALGMRFDDRVTGKLSTYAPIAKKIHVELDPAEINKNVKVDVPIVGDVSRVLPRLLPLIEPKRHDAWTSRIADLRGEATARDIQGLAAPGKLHAAHVIHDLWRLTEGNAIVVADVGQNQMWTAQYYRQKQPHRMINSGGLGAMGFGLPASIGARMACPDDEIWLIAGDGGFQMTAAELNTCAQEGIKINIAIINNGHLGMVRQWQQMFYDRRYIATPIGCPDFVKLADAHGLKGTRVACREEVEPAIRLARDTEGTFVIDFRVEQLDAVYPMVPPGANLGEMLRRPESNSEGE